MTAQEAYILAKAYTNKSIEGAGSLKGAACQIKSIEEITGGHRITFEWEDNDGEVSTDTMDVMDGADGNDGVGISSITYKETDAHGNYVYTVTLTDTNTYDIICPKGAQGETGATGATGNGIASIVKTSTAGLVDTYTITYTNGQTTTFTVTNGESITVDSAMSGSSTNPVQNKVITEALALKQNATDSNLQTTADTIVGAINEHEGDIGSLKSGLTTLDNEVNGDATVYPYADVITIKDAIPANLADCNVKIEPVQDLHGYDKPWVGGAGIQKLHLDIDTIKALNISGTWTGNSYEHNGITYECSVDSYGSILSIKSNGTNNGNNNSVLILNASATQTFKAGTYSFGLPSNDYNGNVRYRVNDVSWFAVTTKVVSKTYENDFTCSFEIAINVGATVNNLMWYPMVCLTSAYDGNFYPYSNICPITGHTEASVQRDGGKNLLNVNAPDVIVGKTVLYDGTLIEAEHVNVSGYIYVKDSAVLTYTSKTYNVYAFNRRIVCYDENKQFLGTCVQTTDTPTGIVTITGTVLANTKYVRVPFARDDASAEQLEYGTQATTYQPYQGKTYTIALGDTIYGGTVDFDSGVMTVTHALVDLGTLTWYKTNQNLFWNADITDFKQGEEVDGFKYANFICSDYEVVSSLDSPNGSIKLYYEIARSYYRMWIGDESKASLTGAEFKEAMSGVTVCYELATPFTVQLTPQQIQLLKGTNTITASTGQISVTVNGVSGSIGAVQEQVNELAEDVADVTEDVSSVTTKVSDMAKGYYSRNVVSGKWYKIADISATTWMIHNTIIAFNGSMLKHIVLRYDNDSHTFNNNMTKINSLNGIAGYVGIKFGTNSAELYVKATHIGVSTYTVLTDGVEGTLNYYKPIETAYTDSDMDLIESGS